MSKNQNLKNVKEISHLAKVVDTLDIYEEKKFLKNTALIESGRIPVGKKEEYHNNHIYSNDHIFFSYGDIKGNFYFSAADDIFYAMCKNNYYFNKYALVELKTEYYVIMFDFDFKNKHEGYENYKDCSVEIVDFIIDNINDVLKESFVKPNIDFIYCDKSEGHGVHLYYPNVIVNKFVHCEIYKRILSRLKKDKNFNLTNDQWVNIFDACISKANGLRLPYFNYNGSFYKQNRKKSTYDISEYDGKPDPNVLKLCCIRTDKNNVCPKTLIETYEMTNDTKIKKTNQKLTKTFSTVEPTKITFVNPDRSKITLSFKTKSHIYKISVEDLDKLLSCINIDKFLEYDDWFVLKFVVFNCNNSVEACKIFHKYCCVGKYKDLSYDETENNFMKTMENKKFDRTVLICYARKDNFELFNKYELELRYDPRNFETIKFNLPKITKMKKSKDDTIIEKKMELFMLNDNDRVFCIISQYGTGKTTFIKSTIVKGSNKLRCLFITHRKTLADDILKNFTDVGFVSYLNKNDFSPSDDKIIVNMDSLKCLYTYKNYFNRKTLLQQYDVIILDEFASLLNNFESSLMGENRNEIHKIFNRLIQETPKIICADGDFSNREYTYLLDIFNKNEINVYENEFKQNPYNFIFTKDEYKFLNEIENHLSNDKKIAITSMSSKKALEFEKYFRGKNYKTLCITGESDGKTKKSLIESEKLFCKGKNGIQLFIYSPCITVGVNIDFPYFYKQYGYMCTGSVCARDYMQMLFRIRQFKNRNITILLNQPISTAQTANFYSINEITNSLCTELGKDIDDLTIFEKLRMWNYWEDINSKNYLFQVFLKLIEKKNHTYEIRTTQKNEEYHKKLTIKKGEMGIVRGGVKKDIMNGIVDAKNISSSEMSRLIKKQNADELTQKEKFSMEKYSYAKKFKINCDDMTIDIMKSIYGKTHVINNYNKLIGEKNDGVVIENIESDLTDEVKEKKVKWMRKIVKTLGFKIDKDKMMDIEIAKNIFDKNKMKFVKIVTSDFKTLFKMKKSGQEYLNSLLDQKDKNNESSNKKFLGLVNGLLSNHGIKIKTIKKIKKKNDLKITSYAYALTHCDVVKIYLKI